MKKLSSVLLLILLSMEGNSQCTSQFTINNVPGATVNAVGGLSNQPTVICDPFIVNYMDAGSIPTNASSSYLFPDNGSFYTFNGLIPGVFAFSYSYPIDSFIPNGTGKVTKAICYGVDLITANGCKIRFKLTTLAGLT